MSSRIYAHMVARNEEHRYLEAVLAAIRPHVDVLHVYDDRSDDETPCMVIEGGGYCTIRDPSSPGFDHEGEFRQAAWEAFQAVCRPSPEDWVLAIDADELLVAPGGLSGAITAAGECLGVVLPIPEVFGFQKGRPMVRTDGLWGAQDAPRLFRYQAGGLFNPQRLGCGSVPTYVTACVQSRENRGVQLLHLGYAEPGDRRAKHARYAGQPGHSAAHIASILREPRLVPWDGPPVDVWRGRR